MYSIVNIPHANNKRAVLQAFVEKHHARVKVVDPQQEPPYNSTGVCDMYIGDHMFEPKMRDELRKMVADGIIRAIEAGRDAGYAQAQSDFRKLIGIVK